MPVSGRDFLAAYVAGFETETRIARAVNFHHYDKGWHPTATLGIFGATAAASRLLELTQDQTATALAIAASFSSGLKANFGTMTKPLHVGHCARNGVMAAMLARAGMTASHDRDPDICPHLYACGSQDGRRASSEVPPARIISCCTSS